MCMVLCKNVGENERIGPLLACVHRVMDVRGKFREHDRRVRVAEGAAETTSSFLSISMKYHQLQTNFVA